LFNWLYARHTGGRFILRIEDTDVARSTQASVNAIFEALAWIDLDWDEGPYFQSQRTDFYRAYLQKLIDTGRAYYCTCTPEQVEAMRAKGMAAGGKPKYDGTCREKGLGPVPGAVVRFKAPLGGTTVLNDIVKGPIVFQNSEFDDFVLARSDGTCTYNFTVVVDDITMGITTVLRGDDHVMNTPKQILLYKALNASLPVFGHLPMVLGNDRTRLSKRHGATSVTAYRDMGFLPEAFINYLVRLGWSCGDQEFFTRQELIAKFGLENIGRSAGIFDPDKLAALNAQHLKNTPLPDIARQLVPFLQARGVAAAPGEKVALVAAILVPRSKTLADMADQALFFFKDPIVYDGEASRQHLTPSNAAILRSVMEALSQVGVFEEKALEEAFKAVMAGTGLKLGKIAQPVRVALTGRTASPGIFEIIAILGKDKILARLQAALDHIAGRT
jgi:glutamyl-tRNA synthetase